MTHAPIPNRISCIALLTAALLPLTQASAEEAVAPALTPALPAVTESAPAVASPLSPGTEVVLEFAETIDADRVRAGDPVKLRLAEDVLANDKVVAPAGSVVSGEIIHASPRRGAAYAAELVITPRVLDTASGQVNLHAPFAVSGADGTVRALWSVAIGGAIGGAVGGVGAGAVVAEGTRLTARVIGADPLPSTSPTSTAVAVPDAESPIIGSPEPGMGQVVIFRPAMFAGAGASFVVRENDTTLGYVYSGNFHVFSAAPGRHRYVTGKNKDIVTLEVAPGEVYYLLGGLIPTGWNPIGNLMPATAEMFATAKGKLRPGEILAARQ